MAERRGADRTGYSATALVFVANERYTCVVLNISPTGLLVIPPLREKPGVFVRLNLTLPALDEVIDVDGVIIREGEARGHYAWGIEFVDPPEHVQKVIRTYIRWATENRDALRRPEHKLPSSKAQSAINDKSTGPAYPAIDVAQAKAKGAKRSPTLSKSARLRGLGSATGQGARSSESESKGRRSSDAGSSFQAAELRKLYRDALKEVETSGED